jgi:hypothetical protein
VRRTRPTWIVVGVASIESRIFPMAADARRQCCAIPRAGRSLLIVVRCSIIERSPIRRQTLGWATLSVVRSCPNGGGETDHATLDGFRASGLRSKRCSNVPDGRYASASAGNRVDQQTDAPHLRSGRLSGAGDAVNPDLMRDAKCGPRRSRATAIAHSDRQ